MAPNISISSASSLLNDINNVLSKHMHDQAPRLSSVASGLAYGIAGSYYMGGFVLANTPDEFKPILAPALAASAAVGGAVISQVVDSLTDQLPSLTRSLERDIEAGHIQQEGGEKLKQA